MAPIGLSLPASSVSEPLLPWILASLSAVLLFAAGVLAWMRQRKSQKRDLPTEWALTPRPVFNADERRVYRQLREALPHHIVLSKLPLVRFCQPTDPQQVRYWYELLGAIHVTFAICSANGRVLAAIDLDTERSGGRRSVQIKQAVLGACRVRYLRCPVDHLPSLPELQLLVPQTTAASRGPQAARPVAPAAGATSPRRRATLWQDSGFFQDSFFGPDGRSETGTISDFGALRGLNEPPGPAAPDGSPRPPPLRH
jgi:hypothetical protein